MSDHSTPAGFPPTESSKSDRAKQWFRIDSPGSRFAIRFVVLAAVLLAVYYFPYRQDSWQAQFFTAYLSGYAHLAGALLHLFDPTVAVHGQEIIGRHALRIVKTCDAMDTQILFFSAVAAWPGKLPRRAVGAAGGILGLFVINVLRICSLYYIGIVLPSFFDFAHMELWPALIVIASVAGFFVFANSTRPSRPAAEAA